MAVTNEGRTYCTDCQQNKFLDWVNFIELTKLDEMLTEINHLIRVNEQDETHFRWY
jgi:hypothetical protein